MTIVLPRAKLEDTNTHASLRGQRQKRQKRFNLGLGLQKAHEFGWAAPWPQSWRPRFERFECFAESTKSFSKTSEEGLADAKSRRTLFIDRKRTKSWKDGSYVNSFSNIPLQWSCGLANFKHSVRSLFILVLWCSVFQESLSPSAWRSKDAMYLDPKRYFRSKARGADSREPAYQLVTAFTSRLLDSPCRLVLSHGFETGDPSSQRLLWSLTRTAKPQDKTPRFHEFLIFVSQTE